MKNHQEKWEPTMILKDDVPDNQNSLETVAEGDHFWHYLKAIALLSLGIVEMILPLQGWLDLWIFIILLSAEILWTKE